MNAHLVVDLAFGDCGKGLLTDQLVRSTGAPWVVRFNGGAQAGHNVIAPDGRHHTFSQFGAGTFAGAGTVLSRHVVLHPTALFVEAERLELNGVTDPFRKLLISADALVVTPYHQALNRLRELARGDARHGSCGVGIGETVSHGLTHPDERVLAGDLGQGSRLAARLARVRERLAAEVAALEPALPSTLPVARERAIFEDPEIAALWAATAGQLARSGVIVPDDVLGRLIASATNVVFEGAQGLLLDEDHGFHPHTTWSHCTFRNAEELLDRWAPRARRTRIGVLRSHMARHGDGPLPSETTAFAAAMAEHNRHNDWQGRVRYGWFDAVLARYALEAVGGVDRLAITHLDLLQRIAEYRIAVAYDPPGEGAGRIARIPVATAVSLDAQEALGRSLRRMRPVLEDAGTAEEPVLARLDELIGRPVDLVSRGPRASDVALRPRPAAADLGSRGGRACDRAGQDAVRRPALSR